MRGWDTQKENLTSLNASAHNLMKNFSSENCFFARLNRGNEEVNGQTLLGGDPHDLIFMMILAVKIAKTSTKRSFYRIPLAELHSIHPLDCLFEQWDNVRCQFTIHVNSLVLSLIRFISGKMHVILGKNFIKIVFDLRAIPISFNTIDYKI